MTAIAESVATPDRLAVAGLARRRWIARSLLTATVLAGLAVLSAMTAEDRVIAAPMAMIAETTLVFVVVLWSRDGVLPLFEAGSLCMLANAVYGIVPLAGFLAMHGQWDTYADNRLQPYPFSPSEIGAFGWRYALYTAAFASVYLAIRGRSRIRSLAFRMPTPSAHAALAIVFLALYACKIVLRVRYGYDPAGASYADLAAAYASMQSQPLWILQIGHNVLSAFDLVRWGVLVLLIARWRKWWARYAVFSWLAAEVASVALRLGSRSSAVLLIISAGVLYHRLVKPLSLRVTAIGGALLLAAFLMAGVVRGYTDAPERPPNVITAANEFQVLFTTAFDIHKRRDAGQISSIPWQLYVSDFSLLIPRQLLPFEKIDPGNWYIDLIGDTGAGVGFMFGVMSQAAIGLDWIELLARGALLAVLLALLHRWYVRRAALFWPTLFYLFIGLWMYFTFRASTFYVLYFVLYHFVPVLLVTKFIETLLSRSKTR